MVVALYVIGCLYLAGLLAVATAALRAPEGFEDDDGFHTGRKPSSDEIAL
jgi:hypothetical protein